VPLPPGNPPVWTIWWNIEDSPELSWDQTRITLVNEAQTEAGLLDFIGCGQAPNGGPILDVGGVGQPNNNPQTKLFTPMGGADTLIYRRVFCANTCEWFPLAIFGVEAFWPLVSGKTMTIRLRPDANP
jgi:hypothetical protein